MEGERSFLGSLTPNAIGIDLSFQTAPYEDRTVSGNRNPTVDGTYRTTLYLGSGSIRSLY